jgi:hypothetical protein
LKNLQRHPIDYDQMYQRNLSSNKMLHMASTTPECFQENSNYYTKSSKWPLTTIQTRCNNVHAKFFSFHFFFFFADLAYF